MRMWSSGLLLLFARNMKRMVSARRVDGLVGLEDGLPAPSGFFQLPQLLQTLALLFKLLSSRFTFHLDSVKARPMLFVEC